MKMRKYGVPFLLFSISFLFTTAPSAAGVDRVKILAGNCTTCHGPNGKGYDLIPTIGGLDKEEILELMQGFKEGTETSTIMDRHAKGYTKQEMEQLADYFSKLE